MIQSISFRQSNISQKEEMMVFAASYAALLKWNKTVYT